MNKTVRILIAGVAAGLLMALLFLVLEFGGVGEEMLPHRPERTR